MTKQVLRLALNISLAGASVLAALVVGEIVVRHRDPFFFDYPTKAFDPVLGWTARPDSLLYRQPGDQLVRYETNELGFRDRSHSRQQVYRGRGGVQRRIRRIVVVGDSFSESLQVELHETFWSRLKERLNDASSDYWEVVNLGVSDYGTVQQALVLERVGMDFRPDLVLLQVFPLNDIANNSLAARNIASSNDAYRPYLDPEEGFAKITYLNPRTSWLRRHSYLLRNGIALAKQRFGPWGRELVLPTYAERIDYVKTLLGPLGLPEDMQHTPILFNSFAPSEEQLPMIAEGWAATEKSIGRILSLAAAGGARVVIVVVPHAQQLAPAVRRVQQRLPFPTDPRYAENRIGRLVEGRNIPVVGLIPTFEANLDTVLPFLEGHFNLETHELVAAELESRVREVFPDSFANPDSSENADLP